MSRPRSSPPRTSPTASPTWSPVPATPPSVSCGSCPPTRSDRIRCPARTSPFPPTEIPGRRPTARKVPPEPLAPHFQPETSRLICRVLARKLISIVRQPVPVAASRCYLIQIIDCGQHPSATRTDTAVLALAYCCMYVTPARPPPAWSMLGQDDSPHAHRPSPSPSPNPAH